MTHDQAMLDAEIARTCERIGDRLRELDGHLVTVESCTGGGIAWHMTAVAGSSDWFDRSLVTYSNRAKNELAGVPEALIEEHGAVSEQTAVAMAEGGMALSGANYALSVTGVAGPGGGSKEKPVGTVCFAWSHRGPGDSRVVETDTRQFPGGRHDVRLASIRHALTGLASMLDRVENRRGS